MGLSPHGRGKLHHHTLGVMPPRSIPARAGETCKSVPSLFSPRVYPRTGGGNLDILRQEYLLGGLSPHGRGKRCFCWPRVRRRRSIPARAGETSSVCAGQANPTVYPRTGGGNPCAAGCYAGRGGLSPHGRGKPCPSPGKRISNRSIPARAGETFGIMFYKGFGKVYPRTGGGNGVGGLIPVVTGGLSPHGRGKPIARWDDDGGVRSIPARAGETGCLVAGCLAAGVYPRTGGGNRASTRADGEIRGLSPHGRGKHFHLALRRPSLRSIPARAGETLSPCLAAPKPAVYPRTGGGNFPLRAVRLITKGLSPHGRGKPRQ